MSTAYDTWLEGNCGIDDAAESAAEERSDWFASLPAEKRAELLWDFIDHDRIVAGECLSKLDCKPRGLIVSVRSDLAGDFMSWLSDHPDWIKHSDTSDMPSSAAEYRRAVAA